MKILLDEIMDGIYFFKISEAGELYSAKVFHHVRNGGSVKGAAGKSSCKWLSPNLDSRLEEPELIHYLERSIQAYLK